MTVNKSVVRGMGIPNYSNALGSISMTIYSPHHIPAGYYVYSYLILDKTEHLIILVKEKINELGNYIKILNVRRMTTSLF
jgi:hypothetical protein